MILIFVVVFLISFLSFVTKIVVFHVETDNMESRQLENYYKGENIVTWSTSPERKPFMPYSTANQIFLVVAVSSLIFATILMVNKERLPKKNK